jgi:uncharacterized phiE125 gp8 family phage protein
MPLKLITPPAAEPVTLVQMKTHLRVETDDEDMLIGDLIAAARLHVESAMRRALIHQTWRLTADSWPSAGLFRLRLGPISAILAARVFDAGHVAADVPLTSLRAEPGNGAAIVSFTGPLPWPGQSPGGIEIDIQLGFGAAPTDVPPSLRHAVKLLVARWYEARGAADPGLLPADIAALIAPWRLIDL